MGANMLMHFPGVHEDFIENSQREACLCFTATP